MKDYRKQYPGRECREFYAKDNPTKKVQGFYCQPDVYWSPEAGYSASVGYSFFDTSEEAIKARRKELIQQKVKIQEELESLR